MRLLTTFVCVVQAPAATTIGDNPDDLTSVFWYHAMQGNFVDGSSSNTSIDSAIFPSVTAGRTLLSNSTIANLEGGKGQVLVWSRNDTTSSIFFLNQSYVFSDEHGLSVLTCTYVQSSSHHPEHDLHRKSRHFCHLGYFGSAAQLEPNFRDQRPVVLRWPSQFL